MAFISGPQVTPAKRTGQKPIDLMEGISAMQLASLVPFVKFTQLDPYTGKPVTGKRSLMYDLIETPQFGSAGPDFGTDVDSFQERALISLNSVRVQTQMEYGFMSYSKVDLDFTVHKPGIVFDRGSKVPWRALLEEGNSFSMEYGWHADTNIVFDNPVFNGEGAFDAQTGEVIRPTRTVLLIITSYNCMVKGNGEVEVSIQALENGDIALRQTKFTDSFSLAFNEDIKFGRVTAEYDQEAAKRLKTRLDAIDPVPFQGKGKFYRVGDILEKVMYPMIESACIAFGYSGVDVFLGNFNDDAGQQTPKWGAQGMAHQSIGNFLIPVDVLKDRLSFPTAKGYSLRLHDVLSTVINTINGGEGWAEGNPMIDGKPVVAIQSRTINKNGGHHLVMTILDRKENAHRLKGMSAIPLEQQSKQQIFDRIQDANIPIVDLGRAGSLILEAKLNCQVDPLFQNILIHRAYGDRKDRLDLTSAPDTETRKGVSLPNEIIPLSILEGNLSMHGNFIFETYGTIWLEFFGSSTLSGIYNLLERTDALQPGSFTTEIKVITEGVDPLNTRRKLTDAEFAAQRAARDELTAKKR